MADYDDVSNVFLKDCYFCVDLSQVHDPGTEPQFCITPKVYFEECGCLHDCFVTIQDLPNGWGNTMEACWEYYWGTAEDGIRSLEALGAQYSQEMHDYINAN